MGFRSMTFIHCFAISFDTFVSLDAPNFYSTFNIVYTFIFDRRMSAVYCDHSIFDISLNRILNVRMEPFNHLMCVVCNGRMNVGVEDDD